MDIKKMPEIKDISKIGKISRIGKEKILLLALAGIMLVGASYFENIKDKKVPDSNVKTKTTSNNYETDMENKVEKLLENINGISKVSVVISFKSGRHFAGMARFCALSVDRAAASGVLSGEARRCFFHLDG